MPKIAEFKFPEGCDLTDKIIYAVGTLVYHCSNCDSLFYGIFEMLVGRANSDNGIVLWTSTVNTRARLDLVAHLAKVSELSEDLKTEVIERCDRFRKIAATRNFFCHAYYYFSDSHALDGIRGFRLDTRAEYPAIQVDRAPDKALLNEIIDTVFRTNELNDELVIIAHRMKGELGLQHIEPPPLPQ